MQEELADRLGVTMTNWGKGEVGRQKKKSNNFINHSEAPPLSYEAPMPGIMPDMPAGGSHDLGLMLGFSQQLMKWRVEAKKWRDGQNGWGALRTFPVLRWHPINWQIKRGKGSKFSAQEFSVILSPRCHSQRPEARRNTTRSLWRYQLSFRWRPPQNAVLIQVSVSSNQMRTDPTQMTCCSLGLVNSLSARGWSFIKHETTNAPDWTAGILIFINVTEWWRH